jgi:hypothetical protein
MSSLVSFEPGFALIAGAHVPVSNAGTHGELQIGDANGPIVRPLSYGERTRIVLRMAGSTHSVENVSAEVMSAALVRVGDADRLLTEIVALALAGAEVEAPPFTETMLAVARVEGWDIHQINQAGAAEIDRLALHLWGETKPVIDDGWNRVVFVDDLPSSVEAVRRSLAERLIARADISPAAAVSRLAGEQELNEPTVSSEASLRPSTQPFAPADISQRGEWKSASAPQPTVQTEPSDFGMAFSSSVPEGRSPGPNTSIRHGSSPNGQRFSVNASADGAIKPQPTSQGTASIPTARRNGISGRVHYTSTGARRLPYAAASDVPPPEISLRVRPLLIAGERQLAGLATASSGNPAANGIAFDLPVLEPRNDSDVDFMPGMPRAGHHIPATPTTGRLSTPVQIESHVADDVADTLAMLLDHEADLRGID